MKNPLIQLLILPFVVVLTILFGCDRNPASKAKLAPSSLSIYDFPNILNYKGIPDTVTDRSVFVLSDLGAWHGFALPEGKENLLGSFIGPFIMTQDNGIWLSDCLSKMDIINADTGHPIEIDYTHPPEINSYPGLLKQVFRTKNPVLNIGVELSFVSNRSSLMVVEIKNEAKQTDVHIQVSWKGDSMLEGVLFEEDKNGVKINLPKGKSFGVISPQANQTLKVTINHDSYEVLTPAEKIKGKGDHVVALAHSFCFSEEEWQKEQKIVAKKLNDPIKALIEQRNNWNDNIANSLPSNVSIFNHNSYKRIAVKCLQTIRTNWRSSAGFLKHDGLFPSYNYVWFNGFWSWDSWKHAVAIAPFDPVLAQDQIKAMYDFQDSLGMIADCVYRDTVIENHNWRDTKPPLSAWAVWEVFQETQDEAFLIELFPKIEKYHQWWYNYRDIDQNGLCEYGSTDGSLVAAKWESGMDNAVRFDDVSIIKNDHYGGSMDRESVDLNAYLFAEKNYLAKIASRLGEQEKATAYSKAAIALQKEVSELFYDEESGWFFDIDIETKQPIKTFGPEGWIPLWTKLATEEQAAKARESMIDTSKFATYIPFPTLAADHPKFKPQNGYWRGPVWLDQAYFAIEGLRNYGYEEDALSFSKQLFDRLEGLKDSDLPIRENYHPLTGEGLESNHFSWSAAHLLMLLND